MSQYSVTTQPAFSSNVFTNSYERSLTGRHVEKRRREDRERLKCINMSAQR